nr:LOW QUALITY PROTEIN: leucine-rich repeat-containing protein 74B [Symphalangus syndactylus]
MSGSCERSGQDEKQEEEATAACGRLAGVPEAKQGPKADSDSDLETEGTHGLGELGGDTLYLRSCRIHSVVPVFCFLYQGSAPELNLLHGGLGPQGDWALASSLSSNLYVKWLNFWDSGLYRTGTEALAGALSKSSSICGRCWAWGKWVGVSSLSSGMCLHPRKLGCVTWGLLVLLVGRGGASSQEGVCGVELDPLLCSQCWIQVSSSSTPPHHSPSLLAGNHSPALPCTWETPSA